MSCMRLQPVESVFHLLELLLLVYWKMNNVAEVIEDLAFVAILVLLFVLLVELCYLLTQCGVGFSILVVMIH